MIWIYCLKLFWLLRRYFFNIYLKKKLLNPKILKTFFNIKTIIIMIMTIKIMTISKTIQSEAFRQDSHGGMQGGYMG